MTAKRWVLLFLATVLLAAALLVVFNILTDPFGIFGDKLMDWYAYNDSRNPRVAKTAWLKEHHQDYDSYIIGCSGSSSIPTGALDRALDAKFYNMIMYGSDMYDVERTARYLVENYTVRNLVISMYLNNGVLYNVDEDNIMQQLHPEVSGKKSDWLDYLFLPPRYGLDKLKSRLADTELPQSFDVFYVPTGEYDKRIRDVEPIGDMDSYLEAYPVFSNYPDYPQQMAEIENCVRSLAAIRDICLENGINLIVVQNPVYTDDLARYEPEQLEEYFTALASVTDYWDFTSSSISSDPRYFYDEAHFRNSVGEMMIARIFGDDTVWMPEDFGCHVSAENAAEHCKVYYSQPAAPADDNTAQVPVLIYHSLSETPQGDLSVSAGCFRAQMEALKAQGYTTVSCQELYDYVNRGASLPPKPIMITFDDGYTSNYDYAYPVLKELGMKATIFVIGVSVGKDSYKDTEHTMTPHFSWDQAREMVDSGLISIYSHTYDLHQWAPFEPEGAELRESVLPLETDSESEYWQVLSADISRSMEDIARETGQDCIALAYPRGESCDISWAMIRALGVGITFGTEEKVNTLIRGLPQSLLNLGRIGVYEYSPEELINLIERYR